MILKELIKHHTVNVIYCGQCECGERKYDLITDDDLVYPPVHESQILQVKSELLEAE